MVMIFSLVLSTVLYLDAHAETELVVFAAASLT